MLIGTKMAQIYNMEQEDNVASNKRLWVELG